MYQRNLETSIKGSDFIFDSVQLMYYKRHNVHFRCSGSYIDSSDWIKTKKATINLKNEEDISFQYAVMVALNYEEIESHQEKLLNFKLFLNKYNWKGINYPSKIDDWKTYEKKNPTIVPNIM